MSGMEDRAPERGPGDARGSAESHGAAQADALSMAYDERTRQLYDARVALADAVCELRNELQHRREEAARLRERVAALETGLAAAQREVGLLRNMKVVRWTKRPREFVYRLRARRR